jgi:preprotein translocase subunit SecA
MRMLERLVMVGTIDRLWVEHLTALEDMRQGIGLAGYGGQDPLVAFKREAHDMWEQLSDHIRQQITHRIFHVTLAPQAVSAPRPRAPAGRGGQARRRRGPAGEEPPAAPRKVGRNDPCPCGSGRKYKKCCGRAA